MTLEEFLAKAKKQSESFDYVAALPTKTLVAMIEEIVAWRNWCYSKAELEKQSAKLDALLKDL